MTRTRKNKEKLVSQSSLLLEKLNFENQTFDTFIHEIAPEINSDSIISFHKCTFKLPFILERVNAKEISFIDCNFEKETFLNKSSISIIGFSNCKFSDKLCLISNVCDSYTIIRNITVKELKVNGAYHTFQIVSSKIEKLSFGDINSEHSQKDSKIEFLVENEIKELRLKPFSTFSNINFKGGVFDDIYFEGTFKNHIVFEKGIKCKNLFFESSIFEYRIDFKEGDFDYVNFYRSNFEGLVYINDFNELEIESRDLKIEKISLHSSTFEKDITIHLTGVNDLSLSNNNFKQQLNFNNYTDEVKESSLVMIWINGTNRGNIVMERVYADINLGGINFGNIFFKNSNTSSFIMTEFHNKGSLYLNEIRTGVFFTIQDSTSGNLNFINTDINIFQEIVIADSNIENATFHHYPKKILSYSSNPKIGYGIKDKSKRTSNLRSIYNQLKQIAKTNGDIDISNKYKSLEHRQLLFSKRLGFDSVLLFLNLISNNNGRSWFLGVIFTLSIAFAFFYLYLKVLGIDFNSQESFKDFALFISTFPKLQLEKYSKFNSTWLVSSVIWLSRIFISYGIYQTISAFRKYGKG